MENLTTFLARADTGMLLVETMTTQSSWRSQAKQLLRSFSDSYPDTPSRRSFDIGDGYLIHYIIEMSVVYMTIAEKSYPKGLAFQFLEDVHQRFTTDHGRAIPTYDRPYAAQQVFDMTLDKIRRQYFDPTSPENVKKMEQDIHAIHNIMVSNIQEVLKRGEKLEKMSTLSQDLMHESKRFERSAKYMNFQVWLRQMGFYIGGGLFIVLVLYW
eukprot:CAMPEP_0197517260 /NCGR_PEP_ID=MMETSP1318-20131121/2248_1 /TAXON_ID=552666 /ORGANISM="Partenskyella glossopodia, Strain RCC365" /LENGTH=211 /DNA_ID=CAMNT_0043066677 /DNA_START=39 /DNA_END=671 /DNA_ORIENTATION=-